MSDDQRDYAEEASNRADIEREGREELAAERVERGAEWLAGQGFSLTDLGPGKYVRTLFYDTCPLGRTLGYWTACERAVPGRDDPGWADRAEAWAEAHGFTTHRTEALLPGEPRWEDLDTAWRLAIERAQAQADAVDMAR